MGYVMFDSTRDLLRAAAARPGSPPDFETLWHRGRRRRRARQAVAAVAAVAVVGLGLEVIWSVVEGPAEPRVEFADDPANPVAPITEPATAASPTDDALRPPASDESGDEAAQPRDEPMRLPKGRWVLAPAGPADGRAFPVAAWTGEKYLVWGGEETQDEGTDSGASYDPATGRWQTMSPSPLGAKTEHVGVWTGEELIICCGRTTSAGADAAAYDPDSDTWRKLPAPPLDAAFPVAVWTGQEMIVTGGVTNGGLDANSATAAYDPGRDTWRQLADAPETFERSAEAVWTANRMIVWPTTGERAFSYDPTRNVWTRLPPQPDGPHPIAAAASLVWTGQEVIAMGSTGGLEERLSGAAYAPSSGVWRRLDVPLPPAEGSEGNQGSQAAAWTGQQVVVVAGYLGSGLVHDRGVVLSYDPTSDEWNRLPDTEQMLYNPHIAVADDRLLVYGPERLMMLSLDGPAP